MYRGPAATGPGRGPEAYRPGWQLVHAVLSGVLPRLIVEFLVPERGRSSDKPRPLPQWGLNAQPLRFLDFLAHDTITTRVEGIAVTLPHPACFALHKLVILSRRPGPEKQAKDKETARKVLAALIDKGEGDLIVRAFQTMPRRWQTAPQAWDSLSIPHLSASHGSGVRRNPFLSCQRQSA